VLKNSFRGISRTKFARKLLNLRLPQALKFRQITALVPFSTATSDFASCHGYVLSNCVANAFFIRHRDNRLFALSTPVVRSLLARTTKRSEHIPPVGHYNNAKAAG
jgi:hypothetical protein